MALETITTSYMKEFQSFPPQKTPSLSLFRDLSNEMIPRQELEAFLHLGAEQLVLSHYRWRGFYSRYFLIPKKKGTGSQTTECLHPLPEVQKTVACLFKGLYKGNWFTALDLKVVYFYIDIHSA